MPSDERTAQALGALDAPIEAFRSALARSVEEIRAYLDSHRAVARTGENGARLGPFAAGRIDIDRFRALLTDERPVDAATLERIESAFAALQELSALKEELFVAEVEAGGDLLATVDRALARIGAAFGAARVAELSRNGRYHAEEHASLLGELPFSRWNAAERGLAPPLVVRVRGADLDAAPLARFLDGRVRLVLLVEGATTPAPLVRLITPRVLVLQTADRAGLERVAASPGPAVAAVIPADTAARFLHDPSAGERLARRLTVTARPEKPATTAIGGRSPAQQADELAQLEALAAAVPAPAATALDPSAVAALPENPTEPADRLAAWLLGQADLESL